MNLSRLREVSKKIYDAALSEVNPAVAIKKHVKLKNGVLKIGGYKYSLNRYRSLYVIGAGKAVASMAKAVERILGKKIKEGVVIVKYGHGEDLEKIKVVEAGHPEPDEKGLEGAMEIVDLIQNKITSSDLVLCLLSGGASALMPLPSKGITLADKIALNKLLLETGADIYEMNCIRKHISRIKGGQLAKLLGGSATVSLILSDVVGDDLSTIASGPTVPDHTTFQDCIRILEKYSLFEKIPASIYQHLRDGAAGKIPETPKSGEDFFSNQRSLVIANNFLACRAAAKKARNLGFHPLVLSSSIEGSTSEVAKFHLALAREVVSTGNPVKPPACLISGGETTVQVKGKGKGGRNQEFALRCVQALEGFRREILIVSLGTDGTDGPTDAAGAVVDNTTLRRAKALRLKPLNYFMENNDSYHFFEPLGDLIITGPTKTNVADLKLILIK